MDCITGLKKMLNPSILVTKHDSVEAQYTEQKTEVAPANTTQGSEAPMVFPPEPP